jgi:hypothetical protein
MPAEFAYFPFEAGAGSESSEPQWEAMFKYMRTTGVLVSGASMNTTSDDLAVTAYAVGLAVKVAIGEAYIKGFMFQQTMDYNYLTIESNLSGDPRIDLVVLELDVDANVIEEKVVTGTPDPSPVAPTPVQNDTVWQLPLATVDVADSAVIIVDADITDLRVSSNQATFSPVCILSVSTDTTVMDGSTATMVWDAQEVDNTLMNWDTMNPERVYIREDGIYTITVNMAWETDAMVTGSVGVEVHRVTDDGMTDTIIAFSSMLAWDNSISINPTLIVDCTADLLTDDYIYIDAVNEAGTDLDVLALDYSPRFSIVKVAES